MCDKSLYEIRNENLFEKNPFQHFIGNLTSVFLHKNKKTKSVKNVKHLAESVRIRKLYFRTESSTYIFVYLNFVIGNEVINL